MKKMIKKYRKAKSFTLVELLIVIVIIGILAGMMMLSTGGATDSATATKIVSDMRNLKAASVMYFLDYNTWPTQIDTSLDRYLDVPLSTRTNPNDGGYSLVATAGTTSGDTTLWVTYEDPNVMTSGVRTKLQNMASSVGLYKESGATVPNTPDYTATDTTVTMLVRQ